jgi:hypothetical protein
MGGSFEKKQSLALLEQLLLYFFREVYTGETPSFGTVAEGVHRQKSSGRYSKGSEGPVVLELLKKSPYIESIVDILNKYGK